MQSRNSLSLQVAGAVALATLFGTSAFAESRHQQGTSRGSSGRIERSTSRSGSSSDHARSRSVTQTERRSSDRGSWHNNDAQRSVTPRDQTPRYDSRGADRNAGNWRGNNDNQRNDARNNNGRYDARNNNGRNDSRNHGRYSQRGSVNDRFRSVEGWHGGSRAPYRYHERVSSYGRVDRYERYHNGYRVWIGGGLFPIFVPFERWRLFPLRVGLNIRFGGYWDPLGYWDVYDYSPYNAGYNYGYGGIYTDNAVTSGSVRGVVESIDYRRGTLVLNDDISRQFVTVTMPRDRGMDDVREGDYVEFSGDWTRGGVFNAYRLDRLDENRDGRRY